MHTSDFVVNLQKTLRVNLGFSSDNNNSHSYSTSEERDYDSLEPPKSLLKWYHYLLDEYKNNVQASDASSKAKVEACGSKAKLQASTKTLIVKSHKLHKSTGVHTLKTDTEMVIHMLVEKKYPLMKKVLLQMLELKLESEDDNTMTLELIKFIKQQI
ncbi:hypothetical protein Tco_1125659 [Tanacetum coccineum]|uniref:Uncharacterized protein n=1 Tax=Tanacetum coccineum TaxID=301880 RepID=A0ABQ5JA58_9ASTR